ncbi:MAG: hypothetical protein GC138_07445 [Gammaproteobacteria bacterium]|nr:hypothetical protein [Gammaproteobacteria bacterium]
MNLTRDEYRQLLEMIEIAAWVLGAHSDPPGDSLARYEGIYQKMLKIAQEAGHNGLVVEDEESGRLRLGPGFDETGMMSDIDEYEESVFWGTLAFKLAVRDLCKQIGEDAYMALDPVDRAERIMEIEAVYDHELDNNGLENLLFENLEKRPSNYH